VIVLQEQPPPNVESLRAFLDARGVAALKFPEQVVIWDALPKNDTGKILKNKVRAELMRQLQG
jgi:non-ribosomal peptide synthetase component E (peptide arylation enzyme)